MRKVLSFILTITMLFSMSTAFAFAGTDTATAATMRVAGFDGTVTITNAKGKAVTVKEDLKLLSGYTIKTAKSSYCYISLDDSKAVKLDQNTKVVVEKSGKKIELNIKSGSIYFDVDKKLKGNESMNIKTSNMTTGVRGTSGFVSVTKTQYGESMASGAVSPYNAWINVDPRNFIKRETLSKGAQPALNDIRAQIAETSIFLLSGSLETVLGNGDAATNIQAGQNMGFGDDIKEIEMPENIVSVIVRAVMEKQIIDSGEMTVAEALSAPTSELAEKVTVTDVPESIQQDLAEAVANPEAVDAAIEAAQEQAALEEAAAEQQQKEELAAATEQQAQTTAPQEAQVFAEKTVKTETGADAKQAIFSGNTPEPPKQETKPSGGSSGNNNPQALPHYEVLTFDFIDDQTEDTFDVSIGTYTTSESIDTVTTAGLFDYIKNLGNTYTADVILVNGSEQKSLDHDYTDYSLTVNPSHTINTDIILDQDNFAIGSININGVVRLTITGQFKLNAGSVYVGKDAQLINNRSYIKVGYVTSNAIQKEFTVYGKLYNLGAYQPAAMLDTSLPLNLCGTGEFTNEGGRLDASCDVIVGKDATILNKCSKDSAGHMYITGADSTLKLYGMFINNDRENGVNSNNHIETPNIEVYGNGTKFSSEEALMALASTGRMSGVIGNLGEMEVSNSLTLSNGAAFLNGSLVSNQSSAHLIFGNQTASSVTNEILNVGQNSTLMNVGSMKMYGTASVSGTFNNVAGEVYGCAIPGETASGIFTINAGGSMVITQRSVFEYGSYNDKYYPSYYYLFTADTSANVSIMGGTYSRYTETTPEGIENMSPVEYIFGSLQDNLTAGPNPTIESNMASWQNDGYFYVKVDLDNQYIQPQPSPSSPTAIDMNKVLGHTTTFTCVSELESADNYYYIDLFDATYYDGTTAEGILGTEIIDMFANTSGTAYEVIINLDNPHKTSVEFYETYDNGTYEYASLNFPENSMATVIFDEYDTADNPDGIIVGDIALNDATLQINSKVDVRGNIRLCSNASITNSGIMCANNMVEIREGCTFNNEGLIYPDSYNINRLQFDVRGGTFTQTTDNAIIMTGHVYSGDARTTLFTRDSSQIELTDGFIGRNGYAASGYYFTSGNALSYILGEADGSTGALSIDIPSAQVDTLVFDDNDGNGYCYWSVDGRGTLPNTTYGQDLPKILYNYNYYVLQNGSQSEIKVSENGMEKVYDVTELPSLLNNKYNEVITIDGVIDLGSGDLSLIGINQYWPSKLIITSGSSLILDEVNFSEGTPYVNIYNYGTINATRINFNNKGQKLYNYGAITLSDQTDKKILCEFENHGTIEGVNPNE